MEKGFEIRRKKEGEKDPLLGDDEPEDENNRPVSQLCVPPEILNNMAVLKME